MTDLLSLLEAAARESIPYGARVERWRNEGMWCGAVACRCVVLADDRIVWSSTATTLETATRICARGFLIGRDNEHTPAVEALRQAVTR